MIGCGKFAPKYDRAAIIAECDYIKKQLRICYAALKVGIIPTEIKGYNEKTGEFALHKDNKQEVPGDA
jgi:hypothetical protein